MTKPLNGNLSAWCSPFTHRNNALRPILDYTSALQQGEIPLPEHIHTFLFPEEPQESKRSIKKAAAIHSEGSPEMDPPLDRTGNGGTLPDDR